MLREDVRELNREFREHEMRGGHVAIALDDPSDWQPYQSLPLYPLGELYNVLTIMKKTSLIPTVGWTLGVAACRAYRRLRQSVLDQDPGHS